jgi:hypothetical protein
VDAVFMSFPRYGTAWFSLIAGGRRASGPGLVVLVRS